MESLLNKTAEELGDGEIIQIPSGEYVFKLSSYKNNPVIKPQDIGLTWHEDGNLRIGSVFNGGAEKFENKIFLLPRCHKNYKKSTFFDENLKLTKSCLENYISEIKGLMSEDGINFEPTGVIIRGDGYTHKDFIYGIEDIRVVKYENKYLLVGCGKIKPPFKGGNSDRIAIYSTHNFQEIIYHGMVKEFDARNTVPFPEEIDGKFYLLFRFHPNIHLDYLEKGISQLVNPAKYGEYWRKIYENRDKSLLLETGRFPHEREKIGPGTQLIKTERGWLLIYHSVGEIEPEILEVYGLREKIERGYSVNAAILSIDNPKKVLCRTKYPIYIPSAPYELNGNARYPVDVPWVVFPTAAIRIEDKLLIYCGSGDKYTILLSCKIDNLVDYLFQYCLAK